MRHNIKTACRATFIAACILTPIAGCVIDFADGCEGRKTCETAATASGVGGAGGAGQGVGGAGAGGEGGGGGGPTPVACVPSATAEPIADECGLFVSSSKGKDDGNTGTKESPLGSFGAAIELAAKDKKRVYACAEIFEGSVVIGTAVELYGGLDCNMPAWPYVGPKEKTILRGSQNVPALRLEKSESGVRVEDFRIEAADASAPSSSSIAVLVNGTTAEFVRCDLSAGAGVVGQDGLNGVGFPANSGNDGQPGVNSCVILAPDTESPGGAEAKNECGVSAESIGGMGGNGGKFDDVYAYAANDGASGKATPANGESDAKGGKGEHYFASNQYFCSEGEDGTPGKTGSVGVGAIGSGKLTPAGYAGVSGGEGEAGTPGKGGGGGGGAIGTLDKCPVGKPGTGASGGSGGAGGCGGQAGKGGAPGGASIALVSYQGDVALIDCTLTSGDGGQGGVGGKGQEGGNGGSGGDGGKDLNAGNGVSNACRGGAGGKGGDGGPGGGGLGGHSLGIAYVGKPPTRVNTQVILGTPGSGGPSGGGINPDLNKGQDGIAAAEQSFQAP